MSDQPIQSGEFNAAMDGLRRTLDRMEKNQDAMNIRIDDLAGLHSACALRREKEAYTDGLTAGKVETLNGAISELKEDKKTTLAFRRSFISAVAVSLLASLLALFQAHSK